MYTYRPSAKTKLYNPSPSLTSSPSHSNHFQTVLKMCILMPSPSKAEEKNVIKKHRLLLWLFRYLFLRFKCFCQPLEGQSDVTTPLHNGTGNQLAVTNHTEFSVNVKFHLVFRVGIQSLNLQEVECGFYLLSQKQSTK